MCEKHELYEFCYLCVVLEVSTDSCMCPLHEVSHNSIGSGDHYLDWGDFSHRLFSQAPSKYMPTSVFIATCSRE